MKGRSNTAGTGVPSGRGASAVRRAVFGSVCFGVGFLCAIAGRQAPAKSAPVEAAASEPAAPASHEASAPSERRRRAAQQPFLVRPLDSCPAADSEGERTYRVQQSRELIGLLHSKVAAAKHMQLVGGAEGIANDVSPWLIGWTDALVRTAPDLVDELAAEIEAGMCDTQRDPAEQMVLGRVLGHMPELANARGIDCIADRGKEDVVLWSALDAWRAGSLPMSPALERLAKSAADERTLGRLTKFAPVPPGDPPAASPPAEPEHLASSPDTEQLMAEIARAKAEGTVTPMLAKLLEQGAAAAAVKDNAQVAEPMSEPAAAEEVPLPNQGDRR